jgi:hypothetical protein
MNDLQKEFTKYMRNAVTWFILAGSLLFVFGFLIGWLVR